MGTLERVRCIHKVYVVLANIGLAFVVIPFEAGKLRFVDDHSYCPYKCIYSNFNVKRV